MSIFDKAFAALVNSSLHSFARLQTIAMAKNGLQ